MLEKAGVQPRITALNLPVIVRCARNIARWWMLEHHERKKSDRRVCFPGDVSMPRGLVPVAIWLGTRKLAGIWRFGGGIEHFRDVEVFGAIGDSRSAALFDALTVYSVAGENHPSWRPFWYRDRFNAWAQEILQLPRLPNIRNHSIEWRDNWCGMVGCPYPYVSTALGAEVGVHNLPSFIAKEDPSPGPNVNRMCFPHWGAHLVNGEPAWEEVEKEKEEEDESSDSDMERSE